MKTKITPNRDYCSNQCGTVADSCRLFTVCYLATRYICLTRVGRLHLYPSPTHFHTIRGSCPGLGGLDTVTEEHFCERPERQLLMWTVFWICCHIKIRSGQLDCRFSLWNNPLWLWHIFIISCYCSSKLQDPEIKQKSSSLLSVQTKRHDATLSPFTWPWNSANRVTR